MTESKPPLFSVTDEHELNALWRLVAEAKFHPEPDDRDLWRSPYVQSLAVRIADAQLELERRRGNAHGVERHLAWRRSLPNNVALDAVRLKLREDSLEPWWKELSHSHKRAYVLARVAPFVVDEAFLDGLIRDVEA